jgi:hypothetical protein
MRTVFEAAGGIDGLRRLAVAWHRRVMAAMYSESNGDETFVGRSTQTADTRVSTGLLRLEFERFREGYSIAPVEREGKNG